ncbi:MAG: hypothetical protein GY758_28275 [Fuerstiella sp.]|jgi:hypothetical protein|nr:hypothetical protein [Fuerstiella sp.]MCP4508061.1 hypothetical protein [Fuerstiella sp.]MDG2129963.1 hypothetical protein [Fuerstiella sp.]
MRSVKNLGRFLIAGTCLFAIVALTGDSASARPKYQQVISKHYPELTAKHGKSGKLSCAVCHPSKSKKKRNNYGVAMGKNVGKKNQSDLEIIKAAIVKAEKEKSATEGKTFGDLIKAGELPGTKDEAN